MSESTKKIAVFGGGCFWCTEAIFQKLKGVSSVVSGYAGGKMDNPSYEDVSGGDTGHAEVVKIEFDPHIISFDELLDIFFHVHDPTTENRQGADVGTQYRSIILYTNEEQKEKAEKMLKELSESGDFENSIVTQIRKLDKFHTAEEYHMNYFENNKNAPYCQIVIQPKVQKFLEKYADKVR